MTHSPRCVPAASPSRARVPSHSAPRSRSRSAFFFARAARPRAAPSLPVNPFFGQLGALQRHEVQIAARAQLKPRSRCLLNLPGAEVACAQPLRAATPVAAESGAWVL